MKVVSFNINGVRARVPQLEAVRDQLEADIIGLQEIKCHSDIYPDHLLSEDYHVYHWGQKGHYGVALYSKYEPVEVHYGFPGDDEDAQRRVITLDIEHPTLGMLRVINGYFPQGENIKHPTKFPLKRKFYADLIQFIKDTPEEYKLIIMGDYNIAPYDNDIGLKPGRKEVWLREGSTSFQPEERGWMDELYDLGLVDTYRALHPDVKDRFSWFDYRSRGFDTNHGLRIDLILCSEELISHVVDSNVDYEIRGMEKPSDHAPVYTVFEEEF